MGCSWEAIGTRALDARTSHNSAQNSAGCEANGGGGLLIAIYSERLIWKFLESFSSSIPPGLFRRYETRSKKKKNTLDTQALLRGPRLFVLLVANFCYCRTGAVSLSCEEHRSSWIHLPLTLIVLPSFLLHNGTPTRR